MLPHASGTPVRGCVWDILRRSRMAVRRRLSMRASSSGANFEQAFADH